MTSKQKAVIWKEVELDEAIGQPHVPATLHFYEDKAVYLIPLDSFNHKEDEEIERLKIQILQANEHIKLLMQEKNL